MAEKQIEQLLALVKELGARASAYIPGAQIVLDPVFRQICRSNQCGRYGRCHMCPPDIGEIDSLMARLRAYPHAVFYQSVGTLEDSFDYEGMVAAGEFHSRLSARIHKEAGKILGDQFLHLSAGCHLCQRCGKMDGLSCRHPDLALGALEGYGVDVYRTVKDTELPYTNGENTVTYFGALFLEE